MRMTKPQNNEEPRIVGFGGVGLDQDAEGHKRLTIGENYVLMGGSEETHDKMQETSVKLNETLEKKGKKLQDISCQEFHETLSEVTEKIE